MRPTYVLYRLWTGVCFSTKTVSFGGNSGGKLTLATILMEPWREGPARPFVR